MFLNGEEVPVRQLKKYENFLFLETAVLANNAWGGLPEETSDPLEQALLEMTREAGEEPEMIRKAGNAFWNCPLILKESNMGTLCKKGREQVLFAKGAADVLLPRCAYVVNPVFSGSAGRKVQKHFLGAAHVIFRQKPNFAAKCSLGKKRYACPCTCMQTIR